MALAIFVSGAATAAVPLSWEVKPGQASPVAFDRFHGESLQLSAEFVGFSEPPFAPGADVRLWYQTNGMGSAWWSAPASVESNRVSAVWSPELDPGAERVTLFFGAPSNAYCSAVLRLRGSPGMVPNALPLPVQRLDFAALDVLNAPYYTQAETEEKILALAPAPGNYATVSNIAMTVGAITNLEPTLSSDFDPDYNFGYVELNRPIKINTGIAEYEFTVEGLVIDGTNGHDIQLGADGEGSWINMTSDDYEYHWMKINGAHVATTNDTAQVSKNLTAATTLSESFSEWTISPATDQWGDPYTMELSSNDPITGYWKLMKNGSQVAFSTAAHLNATNASFITMYGQSVSAWRSVQGYQLGNDTNHILAAQKDVPGDYSTVSNRAMSALQSYTETDPNVPSWAKASSKPSYSWGEIGSKPTFATVATSGSYNDLSDKPTIPDISGKADKSALAQAATAATNYPDAAIAAIPEPDLSSYAAASDVAANSADIADLKVESSLVYRLYSGSNVVCEVTNYNSAVRSPTMRLLQLDTNGVYTVVWTETNNLHRVAQAATNYTDATISAATNRFAPRAWSGVTSGLGAEAPPGVTWISTPQTVLAGGFEYAKVVTTSGEAWILTGNGMTAATNSMGYLDISASDGTSIFRIEKTDSYLVGAAADSITRSGNTVTVTIPIVSQDHPLLRYAPSLDSPVTWYNEEDSNLPASVTYSWGGSSGAWVCTITTSAPSGFFRFEFLQQGSTKIVNAGMTDLSGGIWYKGTKYVPTVSGNELKFVAE